MGSTELFNPQQTSRIDHSEGEAGINYAGKLEKLEGGGGHTGRSKTTYPAHDSFPAKVGPKVGRPIFGLGCSEVTQHSVL